MNTRSLLCYRTKLLIFTKSLWAVHMCRSDCVSDQWDVREKSQKRRLNKKNANAGVYPRTVFNVVSAASSGLFRNNTASASRHRALKVGVSKSWRCVGFWRELCSKWAPPSKYWALAAKDVPTTSAGVALQSSRPGLAALRCCAVDGWERLSSLSAVCWESCACLCRLPATVR